MNGSFNTAKLSVMTMDGRQWREPNMLGVDFVKVEQIMRTCCSLDRRQREITAKMNLLADLSKTTKLNKSRNPKGPLAATRGH